MELRQLRYFIILSERLHFQSAADDLGITQPALSHAIRSLEDDIGVTLFDRSRKKQLRLTPAGEAFVVGARRTLDASRYAAQSANAAHQGQGGHFSIAHTDDFITDILPDVIMAFERLHPTIGIDIQEGASFRLPELLRKGEVDCIFETYPLPQQISSCDILHLPPTRIMLAVPEGHCLSGGEAVRIEQVLKEQHVYIPSERRSAYEFVVEKMLTNNASLGAANLTPTSTILQLELVRRGRGVSCITEGSAPGGFSGITMLPIDHEDAWLSRAFVWRKDNKNPAFIKFLDQLRLHTETKAA